VSVSENDSLPVLERDDVPSTSYRQAKPHINNHAGHALREQEYAQGLVTDPDFVDPQDAVHGQMCDLGMPDPEICGTIDTPQMELTMLEEAWARGCVRQSLKPIECSWSYLACIIGHLVRIWQPLLGPPFLWWMHVLGVFTYRLPNVFQRWEPGRPTLGHHAEPGQSPHRRPIPKPKGYTRSYLAFQIGNYIPMLHGVGDKQWHWDVASVQGSGLRFAGAQEGQLSTMGDLSVRKVCSRHAMPCMGGLPQPLAPLGFFWLQLLLHRCCRKPAGRRPPTSPL
jgi:hypothetical protein